MSRGTAIIVANPEPPPADAPLTYASVLSSPACMHATHALLRYTTAPLPAGVPHTSSAPHAAAAAPIQADHPALAAALQPLRSAAHAAESMLAAGFGVVSGACLSAAGLAQLMHGAAAAVAEAVREGRLDTRGARFMLLYRGPAAIVAGQPHAMGIDGTLTDIHRAFLLPVNAAVTDAFITASVLPPIDPHHGLTRGLQPPSPPPGHAAGGRGAYNGLPILELPPDVATHAGHALSPLDTDEMDVDGAGAAAVEADLKPFHATEVRVAARPWLPLQRLLGGSRAAAAGRGGARATMQVLVPATSQKHLAILRYMSARPCRTRHVEVLCTREAGQSNMLSLQFPLCSAEDPSATGPSAEEAPDDGAAAGLLSLFGGLSL